MDNGTRFPWPLEIFFGDGLSRDPLFLRLKLELTRDTFWPVTAQDIHPCRDALHQARYDAAHPFEFSRHGDTTFR